MKKFISLLLALLMVVSLVTVATVAVGAEPADTKLYFEIPESWNANAYYFCHIWEIGGSDLVPWQGAKEICTKVEGQDRLVSYDVDAVLPGALEEGKVYGIIFSNTDKAQTYNSYFNRSCLGDTMYVDSTKVFENPVNGEPCDAAFFRNSTFGGPERSITGKGLVQGTYLLDGKTDADIFADFMTNGNYENALKFSDYKDCQSLIEYVFGQLNDVTYDDIKDYLPAEFVVPSTPVVPTDPEKPEGTYRYYFVMPDDWYNDMATGAGIYWWAGSDLPGAWPGKAISESVIDGVYYCDVPDDVPTIIWNNTVDGGTDDTAPGYGKNAQSENVSCVNYEDITATYDGMIWVVDKNKVSINDFSGAQTCGGSWFNYDAVTGQVTSDDGTVNFNVKDQKTYEESSAPNPPSTPDQPSDKTTITVGGIEYPVEIGDEVTYTFYWNMGGKVDSIEAMVDYDADVLEFLPPAFDEEAGDYDYSQILPQLDLKGCMLGINFYGKEETTLTEPGAIYYSFSSGTPRAAFDSDDSILCQFKFKVIGKGQATITNVIETATAGLDDNLGTIYVVNDSVPLGDFYALETLDAPEHPTEPDFYVVAGSQELFGLGSTGYGWDPADRSNELIFNETTGRYEKVYENVPAGTYEFKVTTNGAWDIGDYVLDGPAVPGGPNASVTVETDGSTVTISFDKEKAYVSVKAPAVGPTEPQPTEPQPTEPQPTEPQPTNPQPTNPQPTDTTPTTSTATPGSATPDAGSTTGNGNNNAVKTGASEMAIVFFVVLVMAAGVVVFTRKKVK